MERHFIIFIFLLPWQPRNDKIEIWLLVKTFSAHNLKSIA